MLVRALLDMNEGHLTLNSREIKPGDIFVAIPGLTVDGRQFIPSAIQKGAHAVLCEANGWEQNSKSYSIPVIPIPNLGALIGHIAARFYGDPSGKVPVVGITGTNGKTTISHYVAQIMEYAGKHCGMIGTLGIGFLDALNEPSLTTPDPISVQRFLSDFQSQHCNLATLEVSSHALEQHRVQGVNFQTVVFSNLTHEHLDYHGSMEAYWLAKRKLFTEYSSNYQLINIDDPYGAELIRNDKLSQPFGYSVNENLLVDEPVSQLNLLHAREVVCVKEGLVAQLDSPWGQQEIQAPIFGQFNLSNLLAAIGVSCLEGISLNTVGEAIENIRTVPGRMMKFGGQEGIPTVVVDFAHTPDALAQVLDALKNHCRGKLWCVFGCGGDRDKQKRPMMVSAAETRCDHIILTQDNSRSENPEKIIQDMLMGAKEPRQIEVELDRRSAIRLALERAEAQDFIVVAGRGHEQVQLIGQQRIPFSDATEVQKALEGIPA